MLRAPWIIMSALVLFGVFRLRLEMDQDPSLTINIEIHWKNACRYYAIARPLVYHSTITLRTAIMMIILAWLTPSCISFLPIFLGWYTTPENLQYKDDNPQECRFIVNYTYAIVSSSLTFWLPVLIMITLYYKIYLEAKRHLKSMRARQFSLPAVCFTSALPSMCSIGMVTPSTYTLKMAMSSSSESDKYEAVKKAAGEGRRLSDCVPYNHQTVNHKPKRRLSVSYCKHKSGDRTLG